MKIKPKHRPCGGAFKIYKIWKQLQRKINP